MTDAGIELVVTVMEAKDLVGPSNCAPFDTFVQIYSVPDESDSQQTKVSFLAISSINHGRKFFFAFHPY